MYRRVMRVQVVLQAALALVACTRPNPAASCPDGVCSDPKYPFCDVDGVLDGEPHTCIAVSCTPMEFAACNGSAALTCNGSGDDYTETQCATGCDPAANGCNSCAPAALSCDGNTLVTCGSDGAVAASVECLAGCVDGSGASSPHCAYLQPRYVPDVCDTPATGSSLDIVNSETFDSDLDVNCNGGLGSQIAASDICIVHYGTITVEATGALQLFSSTNQMNGTGGRSFMFVSDGDLTISGTVDASGGIGQSGVAYSGPGGGVTVSGSTASIGSAGGGGAGFKTAGGSGGEVGGIAFNAGQAEQDPALLVSFVGGPTTGAGGGGGAVSFIACNGTVSVSGVVAAGGGGGVGNVGPVGEVSGGGGGAGGYVVLQGVNVSVTGSMFANGGGGGGGDQAGATGSYSDNQPAGGGPMGNDGAGAGGNGGIEGIATVSPGNGGSETGSNHHGGGGGGSVGFLQIYTPAGIAPTIAASHLSPQFQPNATVPTR
jgi:hypothetical protein